jgi:hypothetical protein
MRTTRRGRPPTVFIGDYVRVMCRRLPAIVTGFETEADGTRWVWVAFPDGIGDGGYYATSLSRISKKEYEEALTANAT